jgi:hypothetical protein
LLRPFSRGAGIKPRGYSKPLQRRITDYGADVPFGKVAAKLKEHYGIEVPPSSVRVITESHAAQIREAEYLQEAIPEQGPPRTLISEVDGTMIPVRLPAAQDAENKYQFRYKEARLTLSHVKGATEPVFGATLGEPEEAGRQMLHCAISAGFNQNSTVHCVGDGAPWIADQVDMVFGPSGSFLIDFYHLCEYLGAAAPSCDREDPSGWIKQQKQKLKNNHTDEVIEALEPHLEADSVPDEKAPVRKCHRYLLNRPGQFDYQSAIEADLPIGSGEIESAHRYVIQDRLKKAGAWWNPDQASDMLALRTLRANGGWNKYWQQLSLNAA